MNTTEQLIFQHFDRSSKAKQALYDSSAKEIMSAANTITTAFKNGHKLLLCGNGGSAADCQHMAAEFVSRLSKERERPGLPAIALTTDTSFLTAFTNDYNFEQVFARQVQALGLPGDVLLGITTSGSSKNVLAAFKEAKTKNMGCIALVGQGGVKTTMCDVVIKAPSDNTQIIQECHLSIEHVLCDLVERSLFPTT